MIHNLLWASGPFIVGYLLYRDWARWFDQERQIERWLQFSTNRS